MDLIARLKGIWRRHDERLVEEGMETRAAGGGKDLELTPGLDRQVEARARARESAAEHEQPE